MTAQIGRRPGLEQLPAPGSGSGAPTEEGRHDPHRDALRRAEGARAARPSSPTSWPGDPDPGAVDGAAARPARGGRRRDRAWHALHRPDGRRPDDPARRAARARRRPDAAQDARHGARSSARPTPRRRSCSWATTTRSIRAASTGSSSEAKEAGIDGLIIVDLPPEEDERTLPAGAQTAGLNFIRLATPTTDDERLPKVLENTSGFVYYVSITGITGAAAAQARRRRPRGRADQGGDRPARDRGLRHPHARGARGRSPRSPTAAWSGSAIVAEAAQGQAGRRGAGLRALASPRARTAPEPQPSPGWTSPLPRSMLGRQSAAARGSPWPTERPRSSSSAAARAGSNWSASSARDSGATTHDIILVDRNRTHVWKPLLHEVAAGSLDANLDEVGYGGHAARWGYRFFYGTLDRIDRERRVDRHRAAARRGRRE